MSSFEDAIWEHLVEYHAADRVDFRVPAAPTRIVRPGARAATVVALAAIVAAVVVAVFTLTASTTAPPAYALTRIAPGSYTVSLRDVSTGIPALNARFAQLGIRMTVVPIKPGCKTTFEPVQAGPGSLTQTVTIISRDIPPGYHGFLAAEQLPGGRIGLAQGTTEQPIPSCFPTTAGHGIPGPRHRP